MMDFVLQMMNFVLKMMDFALKTMDFVFQMMDFALDIMNFNKNGQEYKALGVAPAKLVLAFAWFGEDVVCTNTSGGCSPKYAHCYALGEDGHICEPGYSTIMHDLAPMSAHGSEWDDATDLPFMDYMNGSRHRVTYSDVRSTAARAQFAQSVGTLGVGVWTADAVDSLDYPEDGKEMWAALAGEVPRYVKNHIAKVNGRWKSDDDTPAVLPGEDDGGARRLKSEDDSAMMQHPRSSTGCSGGGHSGCLSPTGKNWDTWSMSASTYQYCFPDESSCPVSWLMNNSASLPAPFGGVTGVDHYYTHQGMPCIDGKAQEFAMQDALATHWKSVFPTVRYLAYRILSAVPYDSVVQDKIVSDPDYLVRWPSDAGPQTRKDQKCPADGCKADDVCYNYISGCFNDPKCINNPANGCDFEIRAAAYDFKQQRVRDWFVNEIIAPALEVADGTWLDGNRPDNGAYMCGGICCKFDATNSPQNQSQIDDWCAGEQATAVAAHKLIIEGGGYEYNCMTFLEHGLPAAGQGAANCSANLKALAAKANDSKVLMPVVYGGRTGSSGCNKTTMNGAVAAFLLAREKRWLFHMPAALDTTTAKLVLSDYGKPRSKMSEVAGKPGVWQREYQKATIRLDCATFVPTFVEHATTVMKHDDDEDRVNDDSSDGPPRVLAPRVCLPTPLGATKPLGWMRSQLDAQDAGLCGNQYLGPVSGWKGGHANQSKWVGGTPPKGWESAGLAESYVYWMNGYLPLAVQLDDASKLTEIKEQMDFIFSAAAKTGGWLGPLVDGSPWSSFRFCTVLGQYYEATKDVRVSAVFFQYTKTLHDSLISKPLEDKSWAQVWTSEMIVACQWLLDIFGATAAPADVAPTYALIDLLMVQGFDWTGWVASSEQQPWLKTTRCNRTACWFPTNTHDADMIGTDKWMGPTNSSLSRMWTHGVNVAQAMNTWGANYRVTGKNSYLTEGKAAWLKVMRWHRQASGVFTGDETGWPTAVAWHRDM